MRKLSVRLGLSSGSSSSGVVRVRGEVVLALIIGITGALLLVNPCLAQTAESPDLPSETPATLAPSPRALTT